MPGSDPLSIEFIFARPWTARQALPLLRHQRGRINAKAHDLPIVAVFDEDEVNVRFAFLECRFGIVVGGDSTRGSGRNASRSWSDERFRPRWKRKVMGMTASVFAGDVSVEA